MNNPFYKKKFLIPIFILLFVILSLFFVNRVIEKIVRNELNNQLNLNDSSLYMIDYELASISLFDGSLEVRNLIISPREIAIKKLAEGKIRRLVRSRAPHYSIEHLSLFDLLKDKIINVKTIVCDEFFIDYYFNPNAKNPESNSTLAIQQIFSDNFTEASLNTLSINNAQFRFYNITAQDSVLIFEVDSFCINAVNIEINKKTLKNTIPFELEDIQLSTGRFQLKSLEDYYLYITNIDFDIQDTTINIENLKFKPKLNRKAFSQKSKFNTDLFDIQVPKIVFRGLSLIELESNSIIDFCSIEIQEADIDIYRDKRLPDAPSKNKLLLAGLIKSIPVEFKVDSLFFTDCKLTYSEQIPDYELPGKVWFNPMNITATNITNSSEKITSDPILTIDFSGQIMGKSQLDVNLKIHLNSKSEYFTVNGNMALVEARIFNPMIQNLIPLKIADGQILRTSFKFYANNDVAKGLHIMEYENLSVNVLSADDQNRKLGILSIGANGLIRSNNRKDDHKYLTGRIYFERNKDKAIAHFLWNSIRSGVIAIVAPFADPNKKESKEIQKAKKKQ